MKVIPIAVISFLSVSFTSNISAQEFYVYPAAGQSQEQTEKDKYECYSWAKNETGFDPMKLPTASEPPPTQQPKKGGAGRGLLGGAAAGAVIGEIASDDAGKGAAIGAIAGGLFGGMRRNEQVKQEQV